VRASALREAVSDHELARDVGRGVRDRPRAHAHAEPRAGAVLHGILGRAIDDCGPADLGNRSRSAKPLAHTTQRLWSLRVGDWRVIFALREDEVWIPKIGHRSDVYSERAHREPPDDLSTSEPDQDG
jgi:hypothetical protein